MMFGLEGLLEKLGVENCGVFQGSWYSSEHKE